MIKVLEILEVNTDFIICRLSNNDLKKIFLKPLVSNHKHLKGIEKMEESSYVQKAKIGIFGEIFWPDTIINDDGDYWNYDISPEYIYHFGEVFSNRKDVIKF